MGIGMWLPFSPVAVALGFTQLPLLYWPTLFLTVLCYVVLTQVVKMWLIRKAVVSMPLPPTPQAAAAA
jgi:P-type Mg2+ transporter